MNEDIKRLRDLIFNSFDSIYQLCEGSAKELESDTIQLSLYKYIIEKAMWTEDIKNELALLGTRNHNNYLKELYKSALRNAKKNKSSAVSTRFIKQSIEECKSLLNKKLNR